MQTMNNQRLYRNKKILKKKKNKGFDWATIISCIVIFWWFSPYLTQISSVFENIYQLYGTFKYLVPICFIVLLLCRKNTLEYIDNIIPIKSIIISIFSDDTYEPIDWKMNKYNNRNKNNKKCSVVFRNNSKSLNPQVGNWVLQNQTNKCNKCRRNLNNNGFKIRRIIPMKYGGKNTYDNLEAVCTRCL
jgi:hypothetical protein